MSMIILAQQAKTASVELAQFGSVQKNQALLTIAEQLEQRSTEILAANAKDIEFAKNQGISTAIIDRLLLNESRLQGIANDVRNVAKLADPVGQVIDGGVLNSGLKIERQRVPLGVILTIYEARPNVTIDVASLCLKTGNAVILRGGKETKFTNAVLVEVVQQALETAGLPKLAVQAVTDPDRALLLELLKLDRYIDMVIPRGGAGLHQFCKENSTIPVIVGGIGVCHMFVEKSADQQKALELIANAKTQRPSTCNTLETLLVEKAIAVEFLPKLANRMKALGVTLHTDDLQKTEGIEPLDQARMRQEWLSLDLNVVVVDNLAKAVEHIREYGSQHSEAILTSDYQLARQFVAQVDAAAVYINASTRFTDGGEFGLGAEVAVSTQKLHARGPMGLEALTTYKWVCEGDYLVRK
ncbi:glutamate-5-semialdehyde dehydrogenase [Actinobacillus equuli]|uniref:Gamma-glutamyl phosphate reductase n=1 Tax=Actinobacillus equuli subsp. equuli TaxID=202947 RepID=A0A9X4G334_ACTEU|nr:glutamate-5-semialdehyde dehydrogenase [Actinobacillus equuli]MDE8034426.1 glutamate-5-semialdehyde dehydrogenase [Actinobacillus equuli subsp. equuli]MDG4952905.1 glutamate-5-semialdehyde dehydrogenase [Actinobacillus equuli subsp. equuli]WGE50128.1 glutamate-5-semialdehyde dehydrogenase [Actinobacillus equuli subsp. haemolyticus]WGE52237.1 glutamate-5-semialdehyde dehydrogenase [Actinobacillus equuli subsp. haemolyticus]WGE72006.1 glutamate-5-semialdehyde dehydrogenase [Actinobacillus equ